MDHVRSPVGNLSGATVGVAFAGIRPVLFR